MALGTISWWLKNCGLHRGYAGHEVVSAGRVARRNKAVAHAVRPGAQWDGLEHLEERLLLSATLTTLASFDYSTNGANPRGTLVRDAAGTIYGTTSGGNSSRTDAGTVFAIHPNGTPLTTINFQGTASGQGGAPWAGMVSDSRGNLFGTTESAGANGQGTVFEIVAGTTTISTLYDFTGGTDGKNPTTRLTIDANGNIFGTTNGGLLTSGTIFEITAGRRFYTLARLDPTTGTTPSDLVVDSAGNLFGTAYASGANGYGTIFELPAGSSTIKVLYAFTGGNDGGNPTGGLTIDAQGDLFGTASNGGANGHGTIFELTAGGSFGMLPFNGTNGDAPGGDVILDAQGNLFGTTYAGGTNGYGTIFEMTTSRNAITTLYSFSGGSDGANPIAGPILDAQGNLYGTTMNNGSSGYGTAYMLTIVNPAVTAAHQRYVNQLYNDLFNRNADPGGLAGWTALLDSGTTYKDVAKAITSSREYDGDVVDAFYVQYLGRHSDPSGLNDWVNLMQGGYNAEQIRSGILGSPEYFNRTGPGGTGGTNTTFVTALYKSFLNRAPDPGGLAAWVNLLGTHQETTGQVAGGFLNSDENRTVIITGFYQKYMHRAPDPGGLAGWKAQLAAGISQPDIISVFLSVPEYLAYNNIT